MKEGYIYDNLPDKQQDVLKIIRVDSLMDVVKREPFVSGDNISTIMDLDGVLCEVGKKNNLSNNLQKIIALRCIISKSEEIAFSSARKRPKENGLFWKSVGPIFERQSVTFFPFFSKRSEENLERFARTYNSNCKVLFEINPKKKEGCTDKIFEISCRTQEQQRRLVIIGSSFIDTKGVKEITSRMHEIGKSTENIFYFNTNHWFI
jgi:hypothetical protein